MPGSAIQFCSCRSCLATFENPAALAPEDVAELECPICYRPVAEAGVIGMFGNCPHVVCHACLKQWLPNVNMCLKCPYCRTESEKILYVDRMYSQDTKALLLGKHEHCTRQRFNTAGKVLQAKRRVLKLWQEGKIDVKLRDNLINRIRGIILRSN